MEKGSQWQKCWNQKSSDLSSSFKWAKRVALSPPPTFYSKCTNSAAFPKMLCSSSLSLHIKVMMARMTFSFLLRKSYSQLNCYFCCIKSWFLFQAHSYFHVMLNSYVCASLSTEFLMPGPMFTQFCNPSTRQMFAQFLRKKWLLLWPWISDLACVLSAF